MEKFGRRTFLKLMGQFSAILCMGLSQKKALALGGATTKKKSKRIAVEEHIVWGNFPEEPRKRESDPIWPVGDKVPMDLMSIIGDIANIDLRLKDMDAAGIDMQVLSWSGDGGGLVSQEGIINARRYNDKLAEVVKRYPERFAGFSMLPWQETSAAVAELERAVKELGLKGPKVGSYLDNGDRLDNKKYWPIFKKINELDVPMFIHPRQVHPDGIKAYEGYSQLTSRNWGFAADASLSAMRLILSGLFDECPRLKIVLGHMGEGLPFWLWRMGDGSNKYVKENFYVATSGNFFHPALICSYMAMPEHVLFGADWPPESNKEAVEFMETAPILSDSDKEKIYHLNAERIFSL